MVRAMHRLVVGLAVAAACAACGDNGSSGPFDSLPLDGDFTVGLAHPVHVARDKYGIAHISGQTVADVAFVQGYVMAHDRLPQMDILRRFGAGTLAELFGALDPSVIDTDLEMRMHRMKPLAQATWDQLKASSDPTDQQLVQLLQRYADGVNAYAQAIKTDDHPDGLWDLDPNILVSFDPTRFTPWDPVDSLVLGRFQAFALSWSTPFELDATELYQKLRTTFDVAGNPRDGVSRDLLKFTPVGDEPTIDGFPNYPGDTGTRSDGSDPTSGRTVRGPGSVAAAAAVPRPEVPQELFDHAREFFRRGVHTGAFGAYGPHAFMHPFAGSNNWAVGPSYTAGAYALLATDQHLQLPNPSIFYPTHITISDDNLDLLGVTFPGIPGVILGTNGQLAWSATVSEHDVNDVYLEAIAPCGAQSCVAFNGAQIPIETFTETINIGALGTITDTRTATYEVVPHHGPIIPRIANHAIVPRTAAQAMSVKYTGYQPSFEIRALWNLGHATSVPEGFAALKDFTYGSQNWTMMDNHSAIGWTTNAVVPLRAPATYAWDPVTSPDAAAPFFVLPGDGTAEWEGQMSPRYVPHGIDPPFDDTLPEDQQPPAKGMYATANADPVGATFDGNPLNQPVVDGRPLYVGVTYAAGVREERITKVLDAHKGAVDVDLMEQLQHDTHSNVGEKLVPAILTALDRTDPPLAIDPPDLAPYVTGLSAADAGRLTRARAILHAWTFDTPTDSAATAIFNTWMHYFIERSLGDEFTAIDFDVWRLDDNFLLRIVYAMLTSPTTFVQSATTHEPILCDRIATAGADDSCTKVILQALVDAMAHLESPAGFGTADTTQWRWGKLHHLKISPLFPNTALELPGDGSPGFEKSGDNFNVNRSDQGWSDLDFSQYADGPAQRFVAIPGVGQPISVRWALPGGVIFDSRSPHYRDLLDDYYLPEKHFDAPYSVADINANGELRWLFR